MLGILQYDCSFKLQVASLKKNKFNAMEFSLHLHHFICGLTIWHFTSRVRFIESFQREKHLSTTKEYNKKDEEPKSPVRCNLNK